MKIRWIVPTLAALVLMAACASKPVEPEVPELDPGSNAYLVQTALGEYKAVDTSDVTVEQNGSTVVLGGSIKSQAALDRVNKLVQGMDGIGRVENNIAVE